MVMLLVGILNRDIRIHEALSVTLLLVTQDLTDIQPKKKDLTDILGLSRFSTLSIVLVNKLILNRRVIIVE